MWVQQRPYPATVTVSQRKAARLVANGWTLEKAETFPGRTRFYITLENKQPKIERCV